MTKAQQQLLVDFVKACAEAAPDKVREGSGANVDRYYRYTGVRNVEGLRQLAVRFHQTSYDTEERIGQIARHILREIGQ